MTITEKTAYLKGLLEGMNIDQTTNEGKLLAAIIDTMDEIALSVADLDDEVGAINDELDTLEESMDAMDEALDDMDADLDELYDLADPDNLGDFDDDDDDEDWDEDDEDEELYQLTCPTCHEEIVVDEDVLAKGGMKCPACGEELDFDLSQVVEDLDKDPDAE